MFNFNDPETLWLNVTNIGLGIVTLVCLALVAHGLYKEVTARLRKRATVPVEHDDHAFAIPGLGLTMADGGERLDGAKSAQNIEERNIFRSEN